MKTVNNTTTFNTKTVKKLEPHEYFPAALYNLLGTIYDSIEGMVPEELMPEIEVLPTCADYIADILRTPSPDDQHDFVKFRDIYVTKFTCVELLQDFTNSVSIEHAPNRSNVLRAPMLSIVCGRQSDMATPCCKIFIFKNAFRDRARTKSSDLPFSDVCNIDVVIKRLMWYISETSEICATARDKRHSMPDDECEELALTKERLEFDKKYKYCWISEISLMIMKDLLSDADRMRRFFVAIDNLTEESVALFINRCGGAYHPNYQINEVFKPKHVAGIANAVRMWLLSPRTGVYVDTYRTYDSSKTSLIFIFDMSDENLIDNVIETYAAYEALRKSLQSQAIKLTNNDDGYRAASLEQFKKDIEDLM